MCVLCLRPSPGPRLAAQRGVARPAPAATPRTSAEPSPPNRFKTLWWLLMECALRVCRSHSAGGAARRSAVQGCTASMTATVARPYARRAAFGGFGRVWTTCRASHRAPPDSVTYLRSDSRTGTAVARPRRPREPKPQPAAASQEGSAWRVGSSVQVVPSCPAVCLSAGPQAPSGALRL